MVILWQKEIHSIRYPGEIISTKDEGFAISAQVHNNIGILKLNKQGNILWTKYFTDPVLKTKSYANTITEGYDSGYLITGTIDDMLTIIKTNAQGDLSWKKRIILNGNSRGEIKHVVNTADSAYLILLNKQDVFHLVKINNRGEPVWMKSYGDSALTKSSFYEPDFIKRTHDKGYIITGVEYSDNSGMFAIKVDSMGKKQWGISAGKALGWRLVTCADAANDDTYIINGTISKGTAFGKLVTVKLNSNGHIKWSTLHELQQRPVLDKLEAVHTSDGGLVVASTGYRHTFNSISLLKLDKNGYSCNGIADSLKEKNFGNMFTSKLLRLTDIAGTTDSAKVTIEDIIVTVDTLCSSQGISNQNIISKTAQRSNANLTIFPNPANNNCALSFYADKQSTYSIQCINITGKVFMQKTRTSFAGKNVVNIDVTKFSAGTYLVNIKDNRGLTESCKLVKE